MTNLKMVRNKSINKKKKKGLIVFPDDWIAYSPTILNLVKCLSPDYDMKIIVIDEGRFKNNISIFGIEYIVLNHKLYDLLGNPELYNFYKYLKLFFATCRYKLYSGKSDIVIGVDAIGFLATKFIYHNSIFLSLELRNTLFDRLCKYINIFHLIIQSKERKSYLIGDNNKIAVSYIQNAPIVKNIEMMHQLRKKKNKNLIVFGNIARSNAIESCIECLTFLDKNYYLTLKGILRNDFRQLLLEKYQDQILSERLIIDTHYIEQDMIQNYLLNYYIGFCLYDFNYIDKSDYNNISCPSGKLFNYYASGLPVIATDIVGLNSVSSCNCGVLIKGTDPVEIANRVKMIEKNYDEYSANAWKAAQKYDFKKSFAAFINNISGN